MREPGDDGLYEAERIAARFQAPPVTEVALAVAFAPLAEFRAFAIGDLWREKFKADLPVVQEQPPVSMAQERFEGHVPVPALSFQMLNLPSVPRFWFMDEPEGRDLVQVQPDWFARNWRDPNRARPYPQYGAIRDAFRADFGKVNDFVRDRGLGDLQPIQCEITYINHIHEPDLTKVLTVLNPDLEHLVSSPREASAYNSQHLLIHDGGPVGRLYIQATNGVQRDTGETVSVLTITARGRPLGDGVDGVVACFDLGAMAALQAFVGVTRVEMHEVWSRP